MKTVKIHMRCTYVQYPCKTNDPSEDLGGEAVVAILLNIKCIVVPISLFKHTPSPAP